MNLLLDTHAFIWWAIDPDKLSSAARQACEDPTNLLLLSVASVWEMQIKAQLEKLTLPKPLSELVDHQVRQNGLSLLSIELPHIYALQGLPLHHRDPFDRLIIAQAIVAGLTIVTADSAFRSYAALLLW
jgi:PIN domain nuclease of toxin-antitoxin system